MRWQPTGTRPSYAKHAEARVTRSQHPLVIKLSQELAKVQATLTKQSARLVEQQQLNHQLTLRIREFEHEIERGAPVERDSHNSKRTREAPASFPFVFDL